MFDSLADKMKEDDKKTQSTTERVVVWAVVAVASIVLFGGLYFGVRLLE